MIECCCGEGRWGLAADVANHEPVSNVNGARLGGPHQCCLFFPAPTSRQWTNTRAVRVSRRHTGPRRLAELAELAERVKIRSPSHDSPQHVGHPLTGRPRPYGPPSHLSVFRASYIPPPCRKSGCIQTEEGRNVFAHGRRAVCPRTVEARAMCVGRCQEHFAGAAPQRTLSRTAPLVDLVNLENSPHGKIVHTREGSLLIYICRRR